MGTPGRREWSFAETKALINCYAARKEEFLHTRKNTYAWQNVLLDLEGLEILASSTTVEHLQGKMKSLLRAYKSARDKENSTGSAPVTFPYFTEMDDVFGDRPIISNTHTINSITVKPAEREPRTPSEKVAVSTSEAKKRHLSNQAVPSSCKKNKYEEKRKLFEEKKDLLLFLNAEQNKRHDNLIEVLKNKN